MSYEDHTINKESPKFSLKTEIGRDHDSMDDFEHLENDAHEAHGQRKPQLSEHDLSRVDNLIDIGKSFDTNFAKKTTIDDTTVKNEESPRPVPATPPPSADFEKCEMMAQSSDPFQRQGVQMLVPGDDYQQQTVTDTTTSKIDPKAATLAFMDTERSLYAHMTDEQGHENDKRTSLEKDIDEFEVRSTTDTDKSTPMKSMVAGAAADSIVTGDLLGGGMTTPFDDQPSKINLDTDNTLLYQGNAAKVDAIFEEEAAQKNAEDSFLAKAVTMDFKEDFLGDIESSVLPAPEKSPVVDYLRDETPPPSFGKNIMDDDSWNVVERPDDSTVPEPPTKPLPPLPKDAEFESDKSTTFDKYEMSNDFITNEGRNDIQQIHTNVTNAEETGDSEFESEPEPSPAKSSRPPVVPTRSQAVEEKKSYSSLASNNKSDDDIEIAPKQIFRDMGLDAWFNPDRLNPKVAALIYWRDPKKSGIVFGAILGVLLSLAYFSLISVLAYTSLLTLTGTVVFRIYKTVLQAVQKTSDGHPFKDILDLDLTVPSERVHQVADVAVAHVNAAVAELRRLFLVEDLVDSIKFGVLLWSLTYVGSWFNGMTLIIIGVVALFTLPKVYETNQAQIDQNLALVQGKINELTAKVKAAIPLGKKPEPTKEE